MSGDTTIQILGIATGGAVAVIPIWSAAFPAQRIWLPQRYSRFVAPIIWKGTITNFGAALSIGASGRATAPLLGDIRPRVCPSHHREYGGLARRFPVRFRRDTRSQGHTCHHRALPLLQLSSIRSQYKAF